MPELCDRCRRPAPPVESDEYVEWEPSERGDGSVGVICPGCLTAEESDEIVGDAEAAIASLSACQRCGRPAPDFNAGDPMARSYGDPESHGWYVVGDGIVCAACATQSEVDAATGQGDGS